MNVTATAKWRTVPMDPEMKARGFSEGLLGIEELTDYNFVKINRKKPLEKQSGKVTKIEGSKIVKAKKRPLAEGAEDSEEKPKKKKKTRQKRKPKDKKKKPAKDKPEVVLSDEDEQLDAEDHEGFDVEEPIELEGWKDLPVPKPVLRALKELKFNEPTPIQMQTLPAAIGGHADVLGAAETGSGKTLAFAIPIIHGILADRESEESMEEQEVASEEEESSDEEEDMENDELETGCIRVVNDVEFNFDVDIIEEEPVAYVNPFLNGSKGKKRKFQVGKLRALILTPTRELAIQVKNHIQAASKYTDIKTVVVLGGMAPQKQIRQLDQAPEIVVATPGRLWDLVQEGHPHLAQLKDIRYLAIDETDRMVEKGHFEELQNLLALLNEDEARKKRRQNFVFSATLSLVHEMPKHLKQKKGKKPMTPEEKLKQVMEMIGVKPRPKIVDLTRKVGTAETLTESRIHCSSTEKDLYLYYFLQQHPGRTIVFCNSIDCVRRLVNLFGLLNTEPLGLHAQMHQKQRLKNLDRFSANPHGFLIATDVAARGLDIPDVQHVVHYQVPRTSESYVHRSGRTARAKKEGVSVVLIDASENQFYRRMCRTLNRDEDLPPFPVDNQILSLVKVRVNTARELDKLLLAEKKAEVSKNWLKKAAEEAELELSESEPEDEFGDSKSKVHADQKNRIRMKKAELNGLLSAPIHAQGFSGKYPTMSGRLQMPADFKGHDDSSAVEALSKSKAEMKALLRSKGPAKAKVNIVKKKKKKGKR